MYRLIIDIGEPLNALFCEALVEVIGNCEVTPLTENYCVLEGFKMDGSKEFFNKLLKFVDQSSNKSLIAASKVGIDDQIQWLLDFPEKGLLCEFEPPEIILFNKIQISNQLWCVIPWSTPILEEF